MAEREHVVTQPKFEETLAERRSLVRIIVTYAATGYVFIGSIALIIALWVAEDLSAAKEVFTMVLPIATGIITYWFASRKPEQDLQGPNDKKRDENK